MPRVTCHVSRVTCHMSRVTSHIYIFFFRGGKEVKLVGGGSVINGASPSSYNIILLVIQILTVYHTNILINTTVPKHRGLSDKSYNSLILESTVSLDVILTPLFLVGRVTPPFRAWITACFMIASVSFFWRNLRNKICSFLAVRMVLISFSNMSFLLLLLVVAILTILKLGIGTDMVMWLLLRTLKVSPASEDGLSAAAAQPETRRRRTKMVIARSGPHSCCRGRGRG